MKKIHIEDIVLIPNIFSLLRLILLPEFIWFYVIGEKSAALCILALSAVSDFLDGRSARDLGQVTPLGRILDPVADKLTQICVAVCLAFDYHIVVLLAGLLVIKEGSAALAGIFLLRRGGEPFDSRWFGKLSTAMVYVLGVLLLFGPKQRTAVWMTIPVIVMLVLSLIMYLIEYVHRIEVTYQEEINRFTN